MCGCGHTLRAIRFRANTSEHQVDAAEEKLCLASADMTTSRFVCRTLRKRNARGVKQGTHDLKKRGENSVTNSRADCALTQQMIGCITAISPCVKSGSAELFPDLPHTMSAPSGEERTLDAAAQVERARDGAAAALTVARTRGVAMPNCNHMVLVSSASGLRVRGSAHRGLPPRSAILSAFYPEYGFIRIKPYHRMRKGLSS